MPASVAAIPSTISDAPKIWVLSGENPESLPSNESAACPSRSMPKPRLIIARLVRIQAKSVRSAASRFRSRASSFAREVAEPLPLSDGEIVMEGKDTNPCGTCRRGR